ncbi:hypothetical protein AaE_013246 [Aphanomyces astaci]|uniref:Uncharacterized protein n=1 Tax=Aphanomyces astaci TaxID=112090 RepID=A0A6A4Z648_APHAT|nr:hypothetical protein AaE_013246 [Aphanomyces astaci]
MAQQGSKTYIKSKLGEASQAVKAMLTKGAASHSYESAKEKLADAQDNASKYYRTAKHSAADAQEAAREKTSRAYGAIGTKDAAVALKDKATVIGTEDLVKDKAEHLQDKLKKDFL